MVVTQLSPAAGSPVRAASANSVCSDGCLNPGLGIYLSQSALERVVDETRKLSAHQCSGDEGAKFSFNQNSTSVIKSGDPVSSRQHDSRLVCNETGGNPFSSSDSRSQTTVRARRKLQLNSTSALHSGQKQRGSRSGFTGGSGSPDRMAPGSERVSLGSGSLSLGKTSGGLVCEQLESSARVIRVTKPGRLGVGDRWVDDSITSASRLCFPASNHSAQVSVVGSAVSGYLPDLTDSTAQPAGSVAPSVDVTGFNATASVTSWLANIIATPLGVLPPQPKPAKSSPVASRDARLIGKGFSPKLLSRLCRSRAKSTNRVYDAKWTLFAQYCKDRSVDPFHAKSPVVADFLLHCFDTRHSSATTLQGYRSALGSVLKLSAGYDPGQDAILAQLIRSFFRERPVASRRIVPWSINLVLRYLKHGKLAPTALLTKRELTLKTVFLLALATGKRCGEIHALDSEVFKVNDSYDSVILKPRSDFLSKTHFTSRGAGTFSQVVIPSLISDPSSDLQDHSLCPVKTLQIYRIYSELVRTPEQKRLIISFMPSKKTDITKQCIANYLRWLVQQAYTDTANDPLACTALSMRPHDVRGLATTLKSFTQVTMADLLAAGVWTTMSTFLRFYCKEFTRSEISDLYALSPFVAAGSILR